MEIPTRHIERECEMFRTLFTPGTEVLAIFHNATAVGSLFAYKLVSLVGGAQEDWIYFSFINLTGLGPDEIQVLTDLCTESHYPMALGKWGEDFNEDFIRDQPFHDAVVECCTYGLYVTPDIMEHLS